jgi:uncharacterized membrane protein YccC
MRQKTQTPAQLKAAIMALSSQLAIVGQQLVEERLSHLDTVNRLRVQVLGLSELRDPQNLLTFRDDLVKYMERILEVASAREAAKRETKEDKNPVLPMLT